MEIMKLTTYNGIAFVILLCFFSGSWAQEMSCITQLLPCITLLNTSQNQSESCCEPLKYVTQGLPECLCSILGTGGAYIPEFAGINMTQLRHLPARCGQPVNFPQCLTGTPDSNTDMTNTATHSLVPASISMATVLLITLQVLWAL